MSTGLANCWRRNFELRLGQRCSHGSDRGAHVEPALGRTLGARATLWSNCAWYHEVPACGAMHGATLNQGDPMQHVYGLNIPSNLSDLVEPKSCALLVYDMQVGICRQIADGKRVVERCVVALAAARRAGMRVVFTRHLS